MPEASSAINFFRKLWDAGFRDLLPIVPPGAPISPNSSLAKRPQAVGKIPGVRGMDGRWHSYGWLGRKTEETDLDHWHEMGAGVGTRGDHAPGLDFDVLDEAICQSLQDLAAKMLGETGIRIGKPPKALMPYRSADPIRWRKLSFMLPGDDRPQAVELIGAKKQWVMLGVHPATGQPYSWKKGPLPPFDALPEVTEAQIDEFMAEAQRQLLAIGAKLTTVIGTAAVDRSAIDQSGLRGTLAVVTEAVRAIPNSNDNFPERDDYLRMGIAIKAALAEYPAEAEELFVEWAMRWEGNANNPQGNDEETVRADWDRFYPPFSMGANWLYEIARPHGFNDAKLDFKPIDTDFDPWTPAPPELPTIHWVDPGTYEGQPIPEREWVVDGWIPKGVVTAIYGDGGIGKTLLSQQLATCVAAGLPFLGLPTAQGKVMCLYCEDSADEIHIRQRAICDHYLLTPARLSQDLRLASRDNADNLLCTYDAAGNMQLTPLWRQLRDNAMEFGASVVIVDTAADTFGGDEIKRTQVRQFIQACLGRLAKEIGGSVILLAHPSQAGIQSGKGTGGSTAWNNSVRSRLYLQQADDRPGDFRRLTKMKANYGKAGDAFVLKWEAGAFVVRSGPAGAANMESMEQMQDRVFLALLDDLAARGEVLSVAPQSSSYAPKLMKRLGGALVEGVNVSDLDAAMNRLLAAGVIKANMPTSIKGKKGVGRAIPAASIFD